MCMNKLCTTWEIFFIYVRLLNDPSLDPIFSSTIERAKVEYNNVFINKLAGIKFDLSIYNFICYMYTCI